MEITQLNKNSKTLSNEIQWFILALDTCLKLYFDNECKYKSVDDIEPPSLKSDTSSYAKFVTQNNLDQKERLALMLALMPHLKPETLDAFFTRNASYDRHFSEFGGIKGKNFNGFLPSGETLLFLLAGKDLKKRIQTEYFFLNNSVLFRDSILKLSFTEPGEPVMSGMLIINQEYLSLFTSGVFNKPGYSPGFPAKLITTSLPWDHLVLDPLVKSEVEEIKTWIGWNKKLKKDDKIKNIIKAGYRSLFYGPPGTGKTLTVSLLGKETGKDVYKIDLSMVVSKYIGETEKNLAAIFDIAETKNWILFFDEADALFGKRTATSSSNDRYANQEIAYLLQRIEDFPGLIILATNLKINLDDAFARRFQSMIQFPMPGVKERVKLWENAFLTYAETGKNINFQKLSEKYALSGGAIGNVLMHCLLYKENTKKEIDENCVLEGIKKELRKEGKTI
ncbi:MAG TPA: ATP-binding protein [Bacteroidia bacterium]